jgi:hypothetical protein
MIINNLKIENINLSMVKNFNIIYNLEKKYECDNLNNPFNDVFTCLINDKCFPCHKIMNATQDYVKNTLR